MMVPHYARRKKRLFLVMMVSVIYAEDKEKGSSRLVISFRYKNISLVFMTGYSNYNCLKAKQSTSDLSLSTKTWGLVFTKGHVLIKYS